MNKRKKIRAILFALMIVFVLSACQVFTGLVENNNTNSDLINIQGSETLLTFSFEDTLTALYEEVNPGIVAINVSTEFTFGSGSGFVIDKEGHIATNLHVVQDATEIQVSFPSGIKTRAEIIGEDSDSDIAIIKVDIPEEDLFPVKLGDSDLLKVGQFVVAIGNPFGFNGSMTIGIVSSIGRTLDSLALSSTGAPFTAGDIIQTDAAINPGNSGGPLLNLDGEVIGINRAIETVSVNADSEPVNSGIGFAVSINILKRVAPALIESGHYAYPYLGVAGFHEITLTEMEALGFDRAIGVLLKEIVEGSPADNAGLLAGDVILSIDGEELINFGDMVGLLFTHYSPGDILDLAVVRDGENIQLELELGERP
jgi:S1-C subfamily serine protease